MSLRVDYKGDDKEKLKKELVVEEFLALTPADFDAFVGKYGGKKTFEKLLVQLLWVLYNDE